MIFHAEKRTGFVMMDKTPLNDPHLSLRAKGLLAYLLSKPPDWRPQIADICKHCREGEKAVRAAMNELRLAGYATLIQPKAKDGRALGSEWVISEKSPKVSPPQETPIKPRVPTEMAGNGVSVKRHPNKNDSTNKNERPKGERVSFEEMRNWPPKESALKPEDTIPIIKQDIRKSLKSVLGLSESSRFWGEWLARAEAAPFRTVNAIGCAEEDIVYLKHGKGETVRNPSGRADWYFHNLDLDAAGVALKAGSRGKPHKARN